MIPNRALIDAWLSSVDYSTASDQESLGNVTATIKSFEVRPPIHKHHSEPCSIKLAKHQFAHSYGNPYVGNYDPPSCISKRKRSDISQIILTLTGTVSGRQYDRVGGLWIGGSSVLRYTSQEPSGAPTTTWTVEKDISAYATLFTTTQPVVLSLDNVVNDKYTGIFDISVTLDFYFDESQKSLAPDYVFPISKSSDNYGWYQLEEMGTHTLTAKLPNNAIRAELEVFISGHGRDEFWYGNDPEIDMPDLGVFKGGPYKELIVYLNDQLIGIDGIFPTIYTGGFNPLLWRPVVAM